MHPSPAGWLLSLLLLEVLLLPKLSLPAYSADVTVQLGLPANVFWQLTASRILQQYDAENPSGCTANSGLGWLSGTEQQQLWLALKHLEQGQPWCSTRSMQQLRGLSDKARFNTT